MSVGDQGPYMNESGDVWVPRTVPYLEARRVAREGMGDYNERLVYVGKTEGLMLGFVRDCLCDEECQRLYRDDEPTGDRSCFAPAWAFRLEEKP